MGKGYEDVRADGLADWALAVEADAAAHGNGEAGRLHPSEEGKNQGRPVSEASVHRTLENLEMHRQGRLVPNGLSEVRYGYQPLKVGTMNGDVAQTWQNPVLGV